MSRNLSEDIELFTAALAQITVEARIPDANGRLRLEGSGIIEKYSHDTVKLRDAFGKTTHYFRDITVFQTTKAPTGGV